MTLAVRHVALACAALFVARLTSLDHGLAAVWGLDRGPGALDALDWATVAGDVLAVVTLLIFARLGNHFRPTTFLAAGLAILGLTSAGSLIPGSATLMAWMLLLSALGVGLTVVASLLIVLHSTPRQGRGVSLGCWLAMFPLAALTGALLEFDSPEQWSRNTYGVLAATVVVFLVVLTQPHRDFVGTFDTFDIVGALLWLVGITALTWLVVTEATPVRATVLGLVVVASFGALIAQTRRRGSAALIALDVLTRPRLAAVLLALVCIAFLLRFADLDHVAQWWSIDHEQAPTEFPGVALWVAGVAAAPPAGYLIDRGARRLVVLTGVLVLVAGLIVTAIELHTASTDHGLVLGLILCGAGVSALGVWFFHEVFHHVSPVQLTVVAGLAVTGFALGSAVGQFARIRAHVDLMTGYGMSQPSIFADIVGLIVVSVAVFAVVLAVAEKRHREPVSTSDDLE